MEGFEKKIDALTDTINAVAKDVKHACDKVIEHSGALESMMARIEKLEIENNRLRDEYHALNNETTKKIALIEYQLLNKRRGDQRPEGEG
jgi:hypothetical protein